MALPVTCQLAVRPQPVPSGSEQRELRIGEAADARWRANLNGQPLAQAADGWQQVFMVPSRAGTVTYTLPSFMRWLLLAQAVGAARRRRTGCPCNSPA
jgi:hypothetical protein